MNTFGKTLRFCRERDGLSVREAGRQLEVSPTTITNLEGGKTTDPRASMIYKLSAFYDLNITNMVLMLDVTKK